ncbi:MAG: acetyl-CoA C-acyltransferase [SAR86 cluster bacterium]|uniref:Acetyl-CoA C-acyltransferase n=1 Tax=SAR86 cluster bacterium TaxID=2030880 RepID=A0A2A4XHH9_9GAMM|nr:MAG: acetyl-CoA C-acyltransferase [SAR86 cluster bacterium]
MVNQENSVVVVAAARTPMGGLQGDLAEVGATRLGAVSIAAAMLRANLSADEIDEVYFGNVVSAGLKQAPARQAALAAGIDEATPCTTISKVCGSGMKAIMIGRDQIVAGNADVVMTGGMENMSATPYLIPKARNGLRLGHGELKDSLFLDGLEDAEAGGLMGSFAQSTADQYCIGREKMDEYAIKSLKRAQVAQQQGYMHEEIAAVSVESRSGVRVVEEDEQPAKANLEKIPKLRPAFKKDGTVTAANSSSISDGAAAVLLMRESTALQKKVTPLARLVAQSSHAQAPKDFCLAPVAAVQKVLDKAGWSVDDVDLFELNEAFAVVPLLAIEQLKLDSEKVNIHGGACALGHPLGASGARILVTLIYALKRTGKSRGVAALCIGGGEATAMAIELV